ncbi:hypothetical protein BOTBODRAFT_193211 [Botryobasidium botryosum FD-172 SS1]|uniref:Uncharacterized protein n=1 Tax=Botryobasidium botryosum (strain FD-172 SS1) TaxID=930990 RepID=A0A067LSP8_BOTB1|nr:hypothetical protein BOTBODRAFT_193211 [Botryobasidium botryosum FD-172 SS1]
MPAKFKTPWKQEGGPIGIAATELARTTPRAPPAAAVKRFWIVSWTGRYHGGAKPKSWQGDGVLVQHGLKCILYDTHEKRRVSQSCEAGSIQPFHHIQAFGKPFSRGEREHWRHADRVAVSRPPRLHDRGRTFLLADEKESLIAKLGPGHFSFSPFTLSS